jgi:hypothetical protein
MAPSSSVGISSIHVVSDGKDDDLNIQQSANALLKPEVS